MPNPEPQEGSSPRVALAIEILRIGVGIVWAMNLVFVVAPANDYFGNFGAMARSFAPSTLGGPALANFVADHATVFSWMIALLTGYLAVAFLLGLTTRWACLLGGVFSAVLLGTQFGSTFIFPGGTDVGEHPLYLVIYFCLVYGGAGRSLSADQWIGAALGRWRAARASRPARFPGRPWVTGPLARFFAAYFVAGVVIAFGIGVGLVLALPATTTPSVPSGPTTVSYENLSIIINASTGWPQYTPANFTVPTGIVVFTITDNDAPMNWSGCPCVVTGTSGEAEEINGTSTHVVSSQNVAHSFNVPRLGLSIYSPGQSVVQFTVDLLNPGSFQWFCIAPCGAGADPYDTPPMGVAGFMTGTMTVG